MHALDIPIFNDRIYPAQAHTPDDDFTSPLQLLAKSIAFADPFSGQSLNFESRQSLRV